MRQRSVVGHDKRSVKSMHKLQYSKPSERARKPRQTPSKIAGNGNKNVFDGRADII